MRIRKTLMDKVFKNIYVRHNALIFIVYIISSICNYIYQVYVGRSIGPQEYGIFGALFSIIYIISVFSNAVQAGSAWIITKHAKEKDSLKFIVFALIKNSTYLGFIGLVLFSLISPIILSSLKIDSLINVAIVGLVVFLSFQLLAAQGIF